MLHRNIEEALDREEIVIVPLAPQPNQLTRWKILLVDDEMGNRDAYLQPKQDKMAMAKWKVCQFFKAPFLPCSSLF